MKARQISAVKKQISMDSQQSNDLTFWLSKTPQERLAAVTKLVRDSIPKDKKMDRTAFSQRFLK